MRMQFFKRMRTLSGIQKAILILVFVLPVLLMDVIRYFSIPAPDEPQGQKTVEVIFPRGAGLAQIADTLQAKNVISGKKTFVFLAQSLGYEKKIRAGRYSVPIGLNTYQLIRYLKSVRENQIAVRLLEGWTIRQIARRLSKKLNINDSLFIALCHDSEFIATLNLQQISLEGYLLPDTYFFESSATEKTIIRRLVRQTLELFKPDSVQSALRGLNLSRHQVLTLASIVEGEAILDKERPVIASLYLNRLHKHYRLQADPTIQYIIDGPPRRLLFKDLKIDSPYNTYLYYGLPPGPINNPGRRSILAVLFPADTRYLYMVADGKGGHRFSTNLKSHLAAKADFDRIRREVRRKSRLRKKGKN